MTADQLRASILQLAIQGKLVEQRPKEGSAKELLEQIKQEKQNLIAQGKIKKEKPLAPITDEEKPFEIPDNWEWIKLGGLCQLLDGKKLQGKVYPYLEVKYLRNKKEATFRNNGKFVKSKTKVILVDGENSGEIFETNEDGYLGSTFKIFSLSLYVIDKYVQYFLLLNKNILRNNKRGVAIPHLDKELFFNLYVPLPPLAEQKRIVEKLEQLLPHIDNYEHAYTKLEQLNKRFPLDIKKSLIQYAIQGKLVEQRVEEGNARELLEQIKQEKQNLIAQGKIKKEKPLLPITDEEKPFEIPNSWEWVRLGDIFQHNTGKALNASNREGIKLKYITTSNLYWDKFELDVIKEMFFTDAEIIKCTVKKGDLLVCEGGEVGRAAIWQSDDTILIQNHIHRLRSYKTICTKFFYYIFYLYKHIGLIGGKGIGIKGLSSQAIHIIPLALPPLAEQKRIVEKLEQLLCLCESLE